MILQKHVVLMHMDISYKDHNRIMGTNGTRVARITRETGTNITLPTFNVKNDKFKMNSVKLHGKPNEVIKAWRILRNTTHYYIFIGVPSHMSMEAVEDIVSSMSGSVSIKLVSSDDKLRLALTASKYCYRILQSVVNCIQNRFSTGIRRIDHVTFEVEVEPSNQEFLMKRFPSQQRTTVTYPTVCSRSGIDVTKRNSSVLVTGPFEDALRATNNLEKCLPINLRFAIDSVEITTKMVQEAEEMFSININSIIDGKIALIGAEDQLHTFLRARHFLLQCVMRQRKEELCSDIIGRTSCIAEPVLCSKHKTTVHQTKSILDQKSTSRKRSIQSSFESPDNLFYPKWRQPKKNLFDKCNGFK